MKFGLPVTSIYQKCELAAVLPKGSNWITRTFFSGGGEFIPDKYTYTLNSLRMNFPGVMMSGAIALTICNCTHIV